jgi:Mlc titration factor MtfA (ptsG expression regulator)
LWQTQTKIAARKVRQGFNLVLHENGHFMPEISSVKSGVHPSIGNRSSGGDDGGSEEGKPE